MKMHCPVIEEVAFSIFWQHPSNPSQLEQQISSTQQHGYAALQWCRNHARVVLKRTVASKEHDL